MPRGRRDVDKRILIGLSDDSQRIVVVRQFLFRRMAVGFNCQRQRKGGDSRSGPANLNSTISGNSGYKAGSKAVWEQGVSNGEEEGIGTTHTPYP